jgi:hypothetical protein
LYESEEEASETSIPIAQRHNHDPAASELSLAAHEEESHPSQISFSQDECDERVRNLDLSNIVGSQSILSQELQDMSGAAAAAPYSTEQSVTNEEDANDESITASQISCLVRAAKEIESPLPSPVKAVKKVVAPPPPSDQSSYNTNNNNAAAPPPPPMQQQYPPTQHPPFHPSMMYDPNYPFYGSTTTPSLAFGPSYYDSNGIHYAVSSKTSKPRAKPALSKTRLEKKREQEEAKALAKRAADLAAQAIANPEVSKELLLNMVYVRTNPRSPPAAWPGKGHVIEEGFFWATYPPLETKLKSFMKDYFELSIKKCQSKEQQAFNNDMVVMIRQEATKYQWSFSSSFSEKALRDRVRCYFKTHIQNAKKRLRTMLMNPTKKANTRALVQHLDMISSHAQSSLEQQLEFTEERKPCAVVLNEHDSILDPSASDPVSRVMSLGFSQLSQDSQVTPVGV